MRAIAKGRSEEGLLVGQELIDRFLPASDHYLKTSLLGLCLSRDLPGGPSAILRELTQARAKRRLKRSVQRLLDVLPDRLDFQSVVDDVCVYGDVTALIDLHLLVRSGANLKALVRILDYRTANPIADLIGWAHDVFGLKDRSTPIRILEEARDERGLELPLVRIAASMFLSRLAVSEPMLTHLPLNRVTRIIGRSVDLSHLARAFADRLRAFPSDQVLGRLRKFLGPGDEVPPWSRFNALAILRELALPGAFELLVDQLGREPDDPAVADAVDALVALGEPASNLLVKRFSELAPEVQVQACRVLAQTGGKAAATLRLRSWRNGSGGQKASSERNCATSSGSGRTWRSRRAWRRSRPEMLRLTRRSSC